MIVLTLGAAALARLISSERDEPPSEEGEPITR